MTQTDYILRMIEQLGQMLAAPEGDLDPARCWLVAEVLYLDGLQAQLEERPEEAAASLRKSLPLYTLLKPKGLVLGLPEAAARITEIGENFVTLDQQRDRDPVS